MSSNNLVFVYGTLKRGQRASYKLKEGSTFYGRAHTPPLFKMYGDGFPMLVLGTPGHSVVGELYSVTDRTMDELDEYEGFPQFYYRQKFPVALFEGEGDNREVFDAWIYYIRDPSVICIQETKPNLEGFLDWSQQKRTY